MKHSNRLLKKYANEHTEMEYLNNKHKNINQNIRKIKY